MLDGLVQGPAPDRDALQSWVAQAERSGLGFSLEIDGSKFSLLADNRTVPITRVPKAGLSATLTTALEALLSLYPGGRATLYSTLRSREFRPGVEIQTLYAIGANGTVNAQGREIEADVTVPPAPLSMRSLLLRGCVLLGVLLLIGLTTLPFVDWRRLLDRTRLIGSSNQGVELDASALAPYLSVKLAAVKQLDGLVELEITRGEKWDAAKPGTPDELLPGPDAKMTWREFLAIAAVKRGTARVCFYDEKGAFTGESNVPLEALTSVDKLVFAASIPRSRELLKKVVVKP